MDFGRLSCQHFNIMEYFCPKCNSLFAEFIEDEEGTNCDLGCSKCKIFIKELKNKPKEYGLFDDSGGYTTMPMIISDLIINCIKVFKLKVFL